MKLKSLLIVIGYIFGVVGGLGFSFWLKTYELVAAIVFLGIIGFPAFKQAIKGISSEK